MAVAQLVAALPRPIRSEHGRDGVPGDSGLPGVRDDAPTLERSLEGRRQGQSLHARPVTEREREGSAVGGGVVILPAPRDAEIFLTGSELQVNLLDHSNVIKVDSAGNTNFGKLSGSGNAFACLDSTGKLYRSASACVP